MVYAKMVNSFPIELVRRSCKISIRCDHVLNYPADHSFLSYPFLMLVRVLHCFLMLMVMSTCKPALKITQKKK